MGTETQPGPGTPGWSNQRAVRREAPVDAPTTHAASAQAIPPVTEPRKTPKAQTVKAPKAPKAPKPAKSSK